MLSCNNESNNNSYLKAKDSIHFYFDKIDKSTLNDSIKIDFNDKILKINQDIKNDSIRFSNYFKISNNYYNLKKYDAFKKVSKSIVKEATLIKDTTKITSGYINLGDYYLKINEYDSAYYYFDKAEVNYVRENLYEKANQVKLRKAIIQYHKSDYLGCEKSIFLTLPFYKRNNNIVQLNVAYTLLGLSKIETKEYDEGLEFLNLAKSYAEKIDVKLGTIYSAINNIGLLYFKKGDYVKSIEFYNQLNNDEIKNNFPEIYTYTKQNLTFSKYKLGNIKDFEKEYREVLENYKELNLSTVLPKVQLSEFYESQNQLEKAQEFALDAYDISVKEKVYRYKLFALKQLANVFPEKATYYSNEYIKLTDSIATIDKKVQNTFARIEYRVDELSNENLLLEQQNKLTIYYSLIIGLIVVMVFVYRWQKQKQREYILIQEQQKSNEEVYNMIINQQNKMDYVKEQEKQKISRELHDGVLGKLFGVRMNLDILNNDANSSKDDRQNYINEIIKVEKQIRQISHELSDETRSIINNYQLMIDKLVDEQKGISGKVINYDVDSKVPWDLFSAQEKINIYRIIQETFQNINKYSNASIVDFLIKFIENKLEISILDNGKGFEVKKAAKGIGIRNMKERARIINATYKISSEVNNGTHTSIKLEVTPYKEF